MSSAPDFGLHITIFAMEEFVRPIIRLHISVFVCYHPNILSFSNKMLKNTKKERDLFWLYLQWYEKSINWYHPNNPNTHLKDAYIGGNKQCTCFQLLYMFDLHNQDKAQRWANGNLLDILWYKEVYRCWVLRIKYVIEDA